MATGLLMETLGQQSGRTTTKTQTAGGQTAPTTPPPAPSMTTSVVPADRSNPGRADYWTITLAAGAMYSAEREANLEQAKFNLQNNPMGGAFGDKFIVIVPYGRDPKNAGGPYSIVYGPYASQYLVKMDGAWQVSPSPAPQASRSGGIGWLPIAAVGAVVLIGIYAATRRK